MTVQAQESLEYKGEKYNLIGLPFESYLELNKNISMDFHYTTANRRGYQGYWKIENNKLFLTNLKSSYYTFEQLFNSTEPIHADWYSGVLEFGFGNFKPNHWWGTYENYLWLKIEKGNVIEKRIRQGIDEYDYDQFVNFGIYKNQNVKDLLFGKINSYNDDVIINYINAIFTSFLDENKIAIIPILGKNYYDKDLIVSFNNSNLTYEIKKNIISIHTDDIGISAQVSMLLEKILSLIFINLNNDFRTEKNSNNNDNIILDDTILINPDHNYLNWALKDNDNFCYPPQCLNRNFNLKKLVGFKVIRLTETDIKYETVLLDNTFEFPIETLKINENKFEKLHSVFYDNILNATFFSSSAIENCQEFLYFIDESVSERNLEHNKEYYEEAYDDYEVQSYEDWLNEEFGDDAETAYWNLD